VKIRMDQVKEKRLMEAQQNLEKKKAELDIEKMEFFKTFKGNMRGDNQFANEDFNIDSPVRPINNSVKK